MKDQLRKLNLEMQYENPDMTTLSGSILLAAPSLLDSNFCRTVLILSEHDYKAGAQGLILNRPLGKNVGDLIDKDEFAPLHEVRVYLGGPVATEHMVLASLSGDEKTDRLTISSRLSAREAASRMEQGEEVMAFVGYSGWEAGQLENELKEHSWISHPAGGGLIDVEPATMWEHALESISPWHYLISKTPPDPSLN